MRLVETCNVESHQVSPPVAYDSAKLLESTMDGGNVGAYFGGSPLILGQASGWACEP